MVAHEWTLQLVWFKKIPDTPTIQKLLHCNFKIHFSNIIICISTNNYVINRWRCPDSTCKKTRALREGSFFANSKLSLQQWLVIMHWWCRQYPVTDAAEEAKVSQVIAIQCYQYLRDVCRWRLINRDAPLLLGGSGHVVQIDESLFRHKVKVWSNTGLKTDSPFVTGTIRLIEDILQEQIFGFLEWWMYPIARHSVICK